MYKRYETRMPGTSVKNSSTAETTSKGTGSQSGNSVNYENRNKGAPYNAENNHRKTSDTTQHQKNIHPLMKFIPQSLYNPETGKVLGFLSTEDLFVAALILLFIDNGDECEENSMLIYALLYILLSEHIDLPF